MKFLIFAAIVFQISLIAQVDFLNRNSSYANDYNYELLQDTVKVNEKSPWLAFLLSYFLPGMGQIYNGETVKGILLAGGFVAGASMAVLGAGGSEHSSSTNKPIFYSGLTMAAVSYLWSLIDAPISASRINDENGKKFSEKYFELKTIITAEGFEGILRFYF
jgi:hypothetical protein